LNGYSINLKKRFFSTRSKLKKYLFTKHKIFLSDAQLKHTNDLVKITIYFYDPTMQRYLYHLKRKIYFFKKRNEKGKIFKRFRKARYYYIYRINRILKRILLNDLIIFDIKKFKFFKNMFYYRYLKKSFRLAKFYLYILQVIYINKSKFRNNYLQGLINIIKKLYKKNVEFNFVNIKYYFFNSKIITQRFILNIKKNRKSLNNSLKEIKNIPLKDNKIKYKPKLKYIFNIKNFKDKFKDINNDYDITNLLLYDLLLKNKIKSNYLKKTIFDNIKYKKLGGFKLEAKGRLTKRFTAARSLKNYKIKGSLVNTNSTFFGQSTSLLRGNFKSNIDYTNLNDKTRIGSFGIKG
jgi:hypothetical protein